MIYPIFAVRDNLIGFGTISLANNDADAARGFAHACMNETSLMNTHARDFTLFRVGELDTDTGEIIPCLPKTICSATDFIVKEKE